VCKCYPKAQKKKKRGGGGWGGGGADGGTVLRNLYSDFDVNVGLNFEMMMCDSFTIAAV